MANSPRLAAAVIGCGNWGQNHVRTLKELGALAAVSDVDGARAQAVADTHGVRSVPFDAVLADKAIDAVILALPAEMHAPMAMRALDAGKHVFIEKPIALASNEARDVVAAGERLGLTVMAGHILRYHNAFVALMAAVEAGRIGAVRHIQSHRLAFGRFHERFDALWDLAPHDLSLVMALTGEAPASVRGENVVMTGPQTDAAHIHMDFAGGITAHVFVSRHSPYKERRFTVTGTEGMIVWDDFADWPQKLAVFSHAIDNGAHPAGFSISEPEFVEIAPNMALTDELAHFLDCAKSGKTPLTNGAQAAKIIEILEKAR